MNPSSEKKGIFISSAKVFGFQVLSISLNFIFQALITNNFGASTFGTITLFISWIGILSTFTVPGIDASMVYLLPRYEKDKKNQSRIVSMSLKIVITISAVFFVIIIKGKGFLEVIGLPHYLRYIFALSILLFSISKIIDAILLGHKVVTTESYYNAIRNFLRTFFCLSILLFPKGDDLYLFLAICTELVLTAILRILRLARFQHNLSQINTAGPTIGINKLILTTLPMFGIGLVNNLYQYLDKAILGATLSIALVGIYKVSESVASLNSVFVTPFVAFWPYISRFYSENRLDKLQDIYRSITLLILCLIIPFSLCIVELSDFLLSIFGVSFIGQGKTILYILILGTFVDALTGPAGAILKMTKYARVSLVVSTIMMILFVALSFIFIRLFGLVGAAIAKASIMILENMINMTLNAIFLKVWPLTKNHFALLTIGLCIFCTRFLYVKYGAHIISPWILAPLQALIFYFFAAVVLRPQTNKILTLIKDLPLMKTPK